MSDASDGAEVLSLVLTVPTIWLALVVLRIWGADALGVVRGHKTAAQWMLLGVAVSFVGQVFDNAYWFMAWLGSYLGAEWSDWWFAHGVISNIPSRQGAGILAGYCHVRSAYEYLAEKDEGDRELLRRHTGRGLAGFLDLKMMVFLSLWVGVVLIVVKMRISQW
jgi:hypothetical protein